jgi:queuine/archaeosine tRNA-ribosyltransferase
MGDLVIFCAGLNMCTAPARQINAILVNAPEVIKNSGAANRKKELIAAKQPRHVLLDSGGFQIHLAEQKGRPMTFEERLPFSMKGALNIAPSHVVKAAMILQPSLVVALDYPIKKLSVESEQRDEFQKKLPINVRWAMRTASLLARVGFDCQRLLLPVQCYRLDDFHVFWRLVRQIPQGGFSMPIRNLNEKQIMQFALAMHDIGARRLHLLGTTKAAAIVVSAYLARQLFEWVSLDSTTWRESAKNQFYNNPNNLANQSVRPESDRASLLSMTCNCPWCGYKSVQGILSMNYTDKFYFLCRHNWWVIEKFAHDAYENAATLANLEAFMRQRSMGSDQITSVMEALSTIPCEQIATQTSLRSSIISHQAA